MLSMRRHANFIKRFKSLSCLFTASVLFPMQISAATSDYDALVIEARGGNSAPLLRYLGKVRISRSFLPKLTR